MCCGEFVHKIGLLVGIILEAAGIVIFMGGFIAVMTGDVPDPYPNIAPQIICIIAGVVTVICSLAMFNDNARRMKIVYYIANATLVANLVFSGASGYAAYVAATGAFCTTDDVPTSIPGADEINTLKNNYCTQQAVCAAGLTIQIIAGALLNIIYIFLSDYDYRRD